MTVVTRKSSVTGNSYPHHENVALLLTIMFEKNGILNDCNCGQCSYELNQRCIESLLESLSAELTPLEDWLQNSPVELAPTRTFMADVQSTPEFDIRNEVAYASTHPMLPLHWAQAHMWIELDVYGGIDQLDNAGQPARNAVPLITPEVEQCLVRILEYTSYWEGYIDLEPGWLANPKLDDAGSAPAPVLH